MAMKYLFAEPLFVICCSLMAKCYVLHSMSWMCVCCTVSIVSIFNKQCSTLWWMNNDLTYWLYTSWIVAILILFHSKSIFFIIITMNPQLPIDTEVFDTSPSCTVTYLLRTIMTNTTWTIWATPASIVRLNVQLNDIVTVCVVRRCELHCEIASHFFIFI